MTDSTAEDGELDAQIAALRKAGRFAEAANLCLQAGRVKQASELHAAVWDWSTAIAIAEEAGLIALAYRHALDANDRDAQGRLLRILPDHPEEALKAALAAQDKGRTIDAAKLHEAAGKVESAAELFEAAGEYFDAARCYENVGQYRRAGILYERRVREDPTDGEAALRLGRILAHFGRYEQAVRALQTAEQDPATVNPALRLLVACFGALDMSDAAADCLARLRKQDETLPVRVEDFLKEVFGDERGLAGLAKGQDATQLLAGRYRIVRALGAGATGRVLLAHDGFYEREVAVKVLTVGSGAQGRDAYARFAREAHVAAGLEHPNVVRVYEFNPDGPFLAMEYMAGGTLEDRLAAGQMPLSVVRHVVTSILRGLQAVHRRGVIHRDLKPANVFFGAAGDVKLGDFGVAHLQDLGATLTGALLGTLAYMAPEQITGSARPRASTDLYAFGVILFRMISGDLPFPGPDFVTQHLEAEPPKLAARRPDVGVRFDPLVQSLLAKDLELRPQSVELVRAQLEDLDWADPEHDELRELVHDHGVARVKSASVPPSVRPKNERYTLIEAREGGAYLAQDQLLDRPVRIEPCDEARAMFLKRLAGADGPYLQAVFDVDVPMGRAILEAPEGSALGALSSERLALLEVQIGEALKALHRCGVVYGSLGSSAIRVAEGRAVLLLPPENASGSQAEDLAQLRDLLAEVRSQAAPES